MSDVFTQTNTAIPDTEDTPTTPDWTPMKTQADYEPKAKEYSAEADGLKEAAKDLATAREAGRIPQAESESEPLVREYRQDAGFGQPSPAHETVEPMRAAEDLSRAREAEFAAAQQANNLTAADVDQTRAAYADAMQQQPSAANEQAAQQPQPTTSEAQPQQQPDIDPEVRAALESSPKLRAAIEAELSQVETARSEYAQASFRAAQVAGAAVLSNFPELANVPSSHLGTAINLIGQQNPERATAIKAAIERTQALYAASQQAQQQAQQLQAQRVEQWVKAEEQK
jgi:hypothetical protein